MTASIEIQGRKVIEQGTLLIGPEVETVRFQAGSDVFTLHIARGGKVPSFPDTTQHESFSNAAIDVDSFVTFTMGATGSHTLTAQLKHALGTGHNFYSLEFTIVEG